MSVLDHLRGARAPIVLAGALSAAPSLATAQAPTQTPVFGARVETVYVDAFVTRQGRPVVGLTAAEFELKDNDVPHRVELVAVESVPLHCLLVFDTSGSVAGEKLAALRVAGLAFLEGLRPGDEAGILTFSEEIAWHARPTTDRAALRTALRGLWARGATAARDALYAALTLPTTPARTLVVLFTDGEDNMSWLSKSQVRAAAERANALVQVVGLHEPNEPSEPEYVRALRQIAEVTGGRFWEAESPSRLTEAFAAIIEAMNTRYILRYEPQGVRRAGWHRIELRLRGPKGDVRARRGYWVGER